MIRGLYSAASSLVAQLARQEIVGDNLANSGVAGYKRESLSLRRAGQAPVRSQFSSMVDSAFSALVQRSSAPRTASIGAKVGDVGLGVVTDPVERRFDQGALQATDRALDVALDGDGFFTVEGDNGQVWYTRNGKFSVDSSGLLVTSDGRVVLGTNGAIQVGVGGVEIDQTGQVTVDGNAVDRLAIVDFDKPGSLKQTTQGNFAAAALLPQTSGAVVRQGFVEKSNVDATATMVEMMSARRSYESAQKMVQMQDRLLDRTVNEVGRVS